MCYSIYLSTTSGVDFSRENSDFLHFRKITADEPFRSLLLHENQWYLGSKSGCSCTFRHLHSVELGFGEPVEWYPEEEDEIAATLIFVRIVRKMIERGHKLDCVDAWDGATKKEIQEMKVNLDEFNDVQFRFFENHHFCFQMSS
jgi:hypothetical protein